MIITNFGTSRYTMILTVAFIFTPIVFSTVRAATIAEADLDYVTSARLRGEGSLFTMTREILPNITGPIIVEATVRVGYAVFTIATLSSHRRCRSRFACVGQPGLPDVHADPGWHVVADDVPGVGARQPRDRRQPDRRLGRGGVRLVTIGSRRRPARAPHFAVDELSVAYMIRGVPREVLRGRVVRGSRQERPTGWSGESGCGKSTTAFAALRYLPSNGRITGGHVYVDGTDVVSMSNRELRELRATRASMVYQDPGSALNPVLQIGPQVIECFTLLGVEQVGGRRSARSTHCGGCASPTPNG